MKKNSLIIVASLLLGALIGISGGKEIQFFSISFFAPIDLIATLFINALLLLVVPLIFSSIVSGVINMQKKEEFSKAGSYTLLTFVSTNLMAIITGFLTFFLFTKFFSFDISSFASITENSKKALSIDKEFSLLVFLKTLIPSSISELLSGRHILGIIIVALFVGFAIAKLSSKPKIFLISLWESIFQLTLSLTHLLMKALPLGVFALVAKQFAITGAQTLHVMSYFLMLVIVGLLLYLFIPLNLTLKHFGKTAPITHMKNMLPAIITGFSTTSSAATLPITIDCLEKNADVPNETTSLVVPLGSALNMAGSALFVTCAAFFLSFVYGYTLTFPMVITTIFITLLATFGIAGIPSAAIVSVIIVLQSLQIPQEAVGILFAVDRILDMARTPTNAYTASCSTMIIHRIQEKKIS